MPDQDDVRDLIISALDGEPWPNLAQNCDRDNLCELMIAVFALSKSLDEQRNERQAAAKVAAIAVETLADMV